MQLASNPALRLSFAQALAYVSRASLSPFSLSLFSRCCLLFVYWPILHLGCFCSLMFCAMLIDGTPFGDQQLITAMGVTVHGQKLVLGLRQGATENATVVRQ